MKTVGKINCTATWKPTRILLFLHLLSLWGFSENYRYVVVDFANVREKPSSGATVTAKLHCTAFFTPADSNENWYYIKDIPVQALYLYRNYHDRSIDGWIHKSLVSDKEQDPLRQMYRSESLEDSVKWAERAFIANSSDYRNPDLDSLLIFLLTDGCRKVGQEEKAAYYRKMFSKNADIYLAHTHGGQIRVIGTIDSSGDFHTLEKLMYTSNGTDYEALNDTVRINRLRLPLLSRKWSAMYSSSSQDYTFYFTKSYIFPFVEEERNAPFFYKSGDVETCVNRGISFGKKDNVTLYHNVFATGAVAPYADTIPTSRKTMARIYALAEAVAKRDGCSFSSLHYRVLPYGMLDITMRLTKCSYCGTGEMRRAVFTKSDSAAAVFTNAFPVYNADNSRSISSWEWFAIKGHEKYLYVIQPDVSHHCRSEKGGAGCGIVLLRVGPDGLKTYEIRQDQCGD